MGGCDEAEIGGVLDGGRAIRKSEDPGQASSLMR